MLKKCMVFIISFLITSAMLSLGDFIIAGVFCFVVSLFELSEAMIVFKWVFTVLLIFEIAILVPYLITYIKNERNETSGT